MARFFILARRKRNTRIGKRTNEVYIYVLKWEGEGRGEE